MRKFEYDPRTDYEGDSGKWPPLPTLSVTELAKLPRPTWLIQNFIAEDSMTMFFGEGGVGKSLIVLDMCLAATTGGLWKAGGDQEIVRPLKTLYIAAEGISNMADRIRAHEAVYGKVDQGKFFAWGEGMNLYDNERSEGPQSFVRLLNTLYEAQEEGDPFDIIVFDTWVRVSSAHGMNENKAEDTASVYNKLDFIRREFNICPVIVHHSTKSKDAPSARGSGNLTQSLERAFFLEKVSKETERPERFRVKDYKHNHIEPIMPFECAINHVTVAYDADGGSINRPYVYFLGAAKVKRRAGSTTDQARDILKLNMMQETDYSSNELHDMLSENNLEITKPTLHVLLGRLADEEEVWLEKKARGFWSLVEEE